MAAGIITDKLTKYYGNEKTAALHNLSLKIETGEVYGFLGANGAGKSTTIRLLLNFLQPSSGSATIMGLDSVRDTVAIKQRSGYLAGDVALYTKPTGRQLLDYLGSFYSKNPSRQVLEKRFEADLDKPIGSLSKGNRQKIGIIQAFMHDPEVIILDEPTSGLDPLMQEAFYTTVAESKARGAAILMSSHNLSEAQRVCDRVGIIKHGKLVLEQIMSGQQTALGSIVFRVTFARPADLQRSRAVPGLHFIKQLDGHTAEYQPTDTIGEALQALGKFNITDIRTQSVDLEDEFLEFYGDKP